MNKLFTKIAGLSLGLAMAIGVGVSVASNRQEAKSVSATTVSADFELHNTALVEGDYVFVTAYTASSTNYTKAMKNTVTSNKIDEQSVTVSNNKISNPDDSIVWHIAQSSTSGYWTIQNIANSKYLASTGTKSQATLVDSASNDKALFSMTLSSGKFVTQNKYNKDNSINAYFRHNKSASGAWACYASDTAPTLYKKASIAVTGVSVAPTDCGLIVGGTQQLTPTVSPSNATNKNVTYSSSATGVATVSSSGLITAVSSGNATITVTTADGGFTATCSVSVSAAAVPVTGVTLNKASTSIEAPNTETLTATVAPNNATNKNVSWISSAPSIATVSNTGVITAVSKGTATITVTTSDGGFTASCIVTVTAPSTVTFIAGTDTGTATGQNDSGTLTKSGISFYCSGWKNDSGNYRLYSGKTITFTSTIGNMAKIEFTGTESSYKISNMGSETTGTLVTDATNNKSTWTGSATTVSFEMTAQGRASQVVVTMESTDPSVELDPSSATSVSMMKGDTDTSVKVLVKNIDSKTWNFTFDEDEQEGIATSSYISVSAGSAVSDVHTLTITTKAVGSTTLHISVSGTACAASIPVTVAAKPASMTIVHSDIHEGELEVITGAYKQVSFSGEDTDGNAYSIAAGDVTPSATSGASHVTLSGSRITGASEGTAVVRYTLNALTSVYAEITVNVVDDYIESVGEPTFATGLTDTQGQSPTVSVFTSRPGTMRSGSSTTVPFENYKFSYTESYAAAEYGSVFSYDFSHGTTVDTTHKLQTIYVFCDIDEAAHGSYTVTVEQFNDPLQTITFTNVTDNKLSVSRGDSFQLEWAYDPENPTDGKEVEFVIDDNDDGIDITVSELGLISIGASSDLGTALVLIQSAHDDTIQDYVYVSAVLETMKYTVREAESLTPVSTVSAGDRVYMVATATDHSNATYEFSGYPGTYGGATVYTTTVAKLQLLVVEAGSSSGTVAFKLSGGDNDGEYISYSGSSNTLNHTSTKDASASWTVNGSTITNANTTARQIWMNWNNGTPRFACYTSKTSTTGYYCPTFIKVTGGDTEYDVTEALFNGVHNNFGTGKTYEWDASCSSFDEDAWLDACVALTEITDYSSYKLNKAVADLSGNEVEVFLAKYDAIIRKFGTTHDHLDRFTVGGINYGGAININPLQSSVNNAGTSIAIIAISAVSLAAIGGYFLFRKKKEN